MSLTLPSVVTQESGDTKLCANSSDEACLQNVKKNISEKKDLEISLRVKEEPIPDVLPMSDEKVDNKMAYHPVPLDHKEIAIQRLVLILPIEEQEVSEPVSDARGVIKLCSPCPFVGYRAKYTPLQSNKNLQSNENLQSIRNLQLTKKASLQLPRKTFFKPIKRTFPKLFRKI